MAYLKWLAGPKVVVKATASAVAAAATYTPVKMSSNAISLLANGSNELFGIAIPDYDASEASVPVIVSHDLYEGQLASAQNPNIGDKLMFTAAGELTAWTTGYKCHGVVVEYNPASAGLVKFVAQTVLPDVATFTLDAAILTPAMLAATATAKQALSHIVSGDFTASIAEVDIGFAHGAGTITKAGFSLQNTGADGTDALTLAANVLINGTTIFTTPPAITKAATDGADSFTAGTGVTVGVINTAADDVVAGDQISIATTLTRTTPEDEMADLCIFLEIAYKVGT